MITQVECIKRHKDIIKTWFFPKGFECEKCGRKMSNIRRSKDTKWKAICDECLGLTKIK
jgi:hypothetical protein